MAAEHVQFFGLKVEGKEPTFIAGMELGFMWATVLEFANVHHYAFLLTCIREELAHHAMQMADVTGLEFKGQDGCRHDHVHVLWTRPGEWAQE